MHSRMSHIKIIYFFGHMGDDHNQCPSICRLISKSFSFFLLLTYIWILKLNEMATIKQLARLADYLRSIDIGITSYCC